LDILFLHEPDAVKPEQADDVIASLLSFKKKGLTKQIGLGGNPPQWFGKYLRPEIFDVVMEFNKLNACSTVALNENLPFCNNHHIKYFAASPLNMGLLGSCFETFTTNPPAWLDKKIC
jgi:aryl-alcohol dehydrogenase-like predicted oxidoreductase